MHGQKPVQGKSSTADAESATAPNTPPCICDHLQRRLGGCRVGGAGAVAQHHALKARSLASRMVVCAHVGRDAGEDEVADAARAQHQLQVRRAEAALPGLSMMGLAGDGVELGNDVPAGLAAHRDAAAGAGPRRCPPIWRERQRLFAGRSARSGRWPSRVWMTCMPNAARGGEQHLQRLIGARVSERS